MHARNQFSQGIVPTLAIKLRYVVYYVLFATLIVANFVWVVQPVGRWAVLHAVYSNEEIERRSIRIVQMFPPSSALFSTGERLDHGIWPFVLAGILWLGGFGIAAIVLSPLLPKRPTKKTNLTRSTGRGSQHTQPESPTRFQPRSGDRK